MHKKFMRRILFLLATVLMISCSSLVYAGSSDTIVDGGTCGEALTWEITSDGTLIIQGSGEMGWYSEFPWEKYCYDIKDLET